MARRAAFIRQEFGSFDNKQLLMLDAGAFSNFFLDERGGTTNAIMACYKKLGLDAVNVSARELADDAGRFLKLAQKHELPLVSSNLIYEDTGETLFSSSLQVEFAGKDILVLGITKYLDMHWQDSEGRSIVIAEPEKILAEHLQQKKASERVVLLAFMPRRELKKMLENIKGIDLVLACDGFSQTDEPEFVGETMVVYPGSQGKFHGQMRLSNKDEKLVAADSFELVFLPQEYEEDKEMVDFINGFRVEKKASK